MIELLIVVGIIGIVAALVIPSFTRYRTKAAQAEARVNLSSVFVAQLAFFGEQARYSDFTEIGFQSQGQNRYWYRSQRTDVTGAALGGPTVVSSTASVDPGDNAAPFAAFATPIGFTATAAANLDRDPTIDRWMVSDTSKPVNPVSDDVLL